MSQQPETAAAQARAGAGLSSRTLTVRDVLNLAPVQLGRPQVLAGRSNLDRVVRWVHVTESRSAARFLEGGEVVLTTGADWPDDHDLAVHVQQLVEAGATALLLELGSRFHDVPDIVVDVCERAGLPLVALHREVQFVAVTEAAHRLLVEARIAELEARDQVQALFADLNRLGSSPETIVGEVGRLLGGPVVLEDVAHRVVCCAPHTRPELDVLVDWSMRSRNLSADDPVHLVEVAARGRRWGRLVALGVDPSLTGSTIDLVLTQAALSLSLGVIGAAGEPSTTWDALRHRRLLQLLTERRFTSTGHALAALEYAGLPVAGRSLALLAWTVVRDPVSGRYPQPDVVRETAGRVAGQLRVGILCAPEPTVRGGFLALLASDAAGPALQDVVEEFVHRLRRGPTSIDLVATGGTVSPVHEVDEILTALARTRGLIDSARPGTPGLLRAQGTELDLLTGAVPSASLQDFVEKMIGPVLNYDARHGSDLLHVLETYLRFPGNRTMAARESHLSRSVFYQRLELLESQLGRDLRDGNTMAALHLAIFVHRQTQR